MTRNRETPDHWQKGGSTNPAGQPLDRKASDHRRPRIPPVPPPPPPPHPPITPAAEEPLESSTVTKPERKKRFRFISSWQFWALVTVIISGGLGFMSVALLFKLPALPNCPAIFWPTASASLRLYCAQLAANKDTVEDLLQAIALVNSLPKDHPLRPEIDRYIEQWSQEILKLAEESFQAGKLEDAIALARKIPENVSASKLVQERIEHWQSIWSKGEEIYHNVETQLRSSNWHQAFAEAVRLTNLENKYWSTTKYDEVVNLIQTARDDSNKLDKAAQLSKEGGLDNLLAAIKLAEQVGANSYLYKEAQNFLTESGNQLLKLAQDKLDQRNWQAVLDIANKIPASVKLQGETQDLIDLANAQSKAEQGTVDALEGAISLAQKLAQGRPLYDKAQQLIGRWQLEIEDVAHLQKARDLAQSGGLNQLRAAIAEAQQIPSSNPRAQEAKKEIGRWTNQIETAEDRPYLDRATQLASFGNTESLQDAIQQASQIRPGRALYQEAQEKIRQWGASVQRLQDQPYLDRAEEMASMGTIASLQDAIQEASKIARGRILYQEAQSKVQQWVNQVQRFQDQPYLDQAEGFANQGNLNNAISVAQQIKSGRSLYDAAQSKIRQWTREIQRQEDQPYLDQADALANGGNLGSAVTTAQQIRSGRVLYGEAQARIRRWERELQAQQNLQSAYQLGNSGTPEGIAAAIRTAREVPSSSKLSKEARESVNRWSYQLLAIAQERSSSDVQTAIAIAKAIPSGTDAYQPAQQQIQAWQRSLEPNTPSLQNYSN